ncbi:YegP family protein [Pseudarthrobacter sp. IC2-21]|uniref:YegP family protein n=1 Tax=Pseudarthrobacter sp. IC2-21 TaxID=3092262 RepID=UPI002A6AC74B|nr:DUF1508 domain-containing protein [Pseudarthrobacter sp. IC2-21]
MAGKFEIYNDKSGGFRFRPEAATRKSSPPGVLQTKAAAREGIQSVKNNAQSAVVDLTEKTEK